jgi:hypothetical protein
LICPLRPRPALAPIATPALRWAPTISEHPAATSGQDAPTAAATAPVTVEQAAAILGVSVTTVKRRIRAGFLRAEAASRPQGTVWLVYLPAEAMAAAEERPSAASVAATALTTTPAPAEAIAVMIQATLAPIIGPLVAEQAALRQINERQADQLVRQAETIGELRAGLVGAHATISALTAPTAAESAEPAPETFVARLRPLAPWLFAALAIVAMVLLAVRW